MTRNSYPSKLLLFGEYLILNQGSALSIPYSTYSLKVTLKSENNLLDEVIEQLFFHAKQKSEFKLVHTSSKSKMHKHELNEIFNNNKKN